jgi:NitT/TauT family transport system ATP-binding protein
VLCIDHLSFSYGARAILEDISLHCEPGEVVGIIGRSGVGKSTLLNVAAGVLTCQSGSVSVAGISAKEASRHQQIGYLFQRPTLLPWLTTEENVALPLKLHRKMNGHERSDLISRVHAALSQAHIIEAANKYPHELSGGMQTRAAIARALAYQPALLLMDEPFGALDDLMKEVLYQDFQELFANSNIASILVTHDLSEAVLLCDRVYALGVAAPGGPSCLLHCELISFKRPRTVGLLGDPEFAVARARLREALR